MREARKAWRLRVLGFVAAAWIASGCASDTGLRALDATGSRVLSHYTEKTAGAAPDEAPPNRFARLAAGRAAPAEGEAAEAPGAASPQAPLEGFLAPLAREGDRIPITLEDCLRRALANNLSIQIARFGPALAHTVVAEATAIFDPSWFMNNAVSRIRRDSGSFLAGAATLTARQWDFASGIQTLVPTGGTVSLAQDWTYLETNSQFFQPNPQYDTDIVLAVAQPLLRGAGPTVARSPIVLARLDHTISLAEFKRQLIDILLDVERTYWDLVVAQRRVEAVEEALEAARENLRVVTLRFQEGKDKRVVVSVAESAVRQREASLIEARLRRAQTSDRLKRLVRDARLPLQEPTLLVASERPITDPMPVNRAMLQQSMLAALRYRPEMDQAQAAIEKSDVREAVARNQLLPRLDLVGSYGLNGLDRKLGNGLDEQFSTEFFDWLVGVELQVPLGNRARRAAHERARLEQALAAHQREDLQQRILLEVSEAVRNLAAAQEAIQATRAAREAAEQSLRDQQANVTAGSALLKDLLDAQRDLAEAKVREMEATVGYMAGLAALERAKGTLLDYNNIRLLEGEK